MKSRSLFTLSTLGLLLLTLFRPADCTAAGIIKVGYPQLSGGSMPLWVIAQNKLDERFGVDIKPVYIAGGAILTHSLIASDVDIALTGGAVVGAILGGADLTYVGIGLSTYAFRFLLNRKSKTSTIFAAKCSASSPRAPLPIMPRLPCLSGMESASGRM
jgi:ABC-type nitrate/sulfonate/bicarbonate transport system substrate-binding protein